MGTMKQKDILDRIEPKRREAMRKILAAGFTAPVVSSFAMSSLAIAGEEVVSGNLTEEIVDSDRNAKTDFADIDANALLGQVSELNVESWRYKWEDTHVRHIGPMAQDFKALFGVGKDDKTINMVDSGGIALAAIQALYRKLQEKDAQIDALQDQVRELRENLLATS